MRADQTVATAGGYNIALGAAAPGGSTYKDEVLQGWRANLISSLGTAATGSVACNGRVCLITIQWDDSRASAGSNVQTLTTQVYL
jgi:type IV pilus assembly protein PilV